MEDIREKLLPSSLSMPNQQPISIDEELWLMIEKRAQEILCIVQPSLISEVNRKEVINYVQRLIRGYYKAEVLPFGSVPLKTYLPDGDIDFTILSHENGEEDLAEGVCHILDSQEDSEFQVKDIQHVPAQVQVVKCTVKNIAVDISFNQMGGIYALRFLEQVDQFLGKNHLFKRSIIITKAWCYYESRILGAHKCLLSTYAVEILVLYIINRFHSSVCGPLEVLYRFLDYYSTFDWENNYVSIYGPKPLSSLPEIVETPEYEQAEFLISKAFLRSYRDTCFVQARASKTTIHEFPTKYMNILDPLRSDNNLGRSVSKSNLNRIKLALSYGARKFNEILTLPGESMGSALEKCFMHTLNRNGKGERPDVEVPVPAFGTGRSEVSDLRGDCDSYYCALKHVHAMPLTTHTHCPSCPSQADMQATKDRNSKGQRPDVEVPVPAFGTRRSGVSNLCGGCGSFYGGLNHFQWYHNYAMPLTADTRFPSSPSQADMHSLSTQQNWSMFYQMGINTYVPGQPLYCAYAPQTTYCLEENPYAPQATYCLEENPYALHATCCLEKYPYAPQGTSCLQENMISRGTGTYIPDKTHNSYWDMHAKVTKPRSFAPVNHNVLPKSPLSKQPVEVLSETDINDKSKSFELSNEDFPVLRSISHRANPSEDENGDSKSNEQFPLLPTICKTSSLEDENGNSKSNEDFPLLPTICQIRSSESQETIQLTENSCLSQLNFELSNEEFPLLPSIRKTSLSKSEGSVQLTAHARNSSSSQLNVELSNEGFPVLPSIRKTSLSNSQGSVQLTEQAKNYSSSQLNVEFSDKEFPPLPRIRKTSASEGRESVQLTEKQTRKSSSSQMNNEHSNEEFPRLPSIRKTSISKGQESIQLTGQTRKSSSSLLNIEFGSFSKPQSLTDLSLPTKDKKEDAGVSSSRVAMLLVPRVAMQRKEEFAEGDEKRWIDSI